MFDLIKKDFIMNRQLLLIFASLPFCFMIIILSKDGIGFALNISFVWSTILPFLLISQEEKNKGYRLLCSLPISKRNLLLSKYLSAWGIIIAALIYYFIFGFLTFMIFKIPLEYAFYRFMSTQIITVIFILSINIALFFPVIIRYGSENSIIIGIVVLNIICAILFSIKNDTGVFKHIIRFLHSAGDLYNFVIAQVKAVGGNAGYFDFILLMIFLMNFVSYRILLSVFSKREL